MGHCCSRPYPDGDEGPAGGGVVASPPPASAVPSESHSNSFATSPFQSPLPAGVRPSASPAMTPGRKFKWPLPPPSPARPIVALLRRRGQPKPPKEGPIPEEEAEGGGGGERALDKSFGYPKSFAAKYELGKEVGRGHFGHTCWAKGKKGDLKGVQVAVKIISKPKMTTAIAIEDVRREVKILKALSGHKHMIKFHDAFEDDNNVYIVMELCEGGELLDRILSRGGRYNEEDAKSIVVQILSVVAFCHLQGVVHRDLKPENFLFTTKDENAPMKIIDFGLSDFIRPDHRLNDIVGSAYYVAPEVLHRSYNVEADMWSIGVITYILLCGSRPFWARTESGIFRSVLRAEPNFDDTPWPVVSPEAKNFLKRLLNKDHRKRMTASQALTHPWLRDETLEVPLDILIFKLVKSYVLSTPFKRAALKALSRAIPDDELVYLRAQFRLLEPKDDHVTLNNFRVALTRHVTDTMKEARVLDILTMILRIFTVELFSTSETYELCPCIPRMFTIIAKETMEPLSHKKMGFREFCAAAISAHQLEAHDNWENIAAGAFEYFEQEGNRVISAEELALEMNLSPASHSLVTDWIRKSDGKLSYIGYTKLLHGVTIRNANSRHR